MVRVERSSASGSPTVPPEAASHPGDRAAGLVAAARSPALLGSLVCGLALLSLPAPGLAQADANRPDAAELPGSPQALDDSRQSPAPIENRTSPPPERPSLVSLLEPLWMDLTPAQQAALAPFAPEWNTWPTAEKKAWVNLADKLPRMSAERRVKAQRRILEWANLSPEQRTTARANFRLAKELSAKEKAQEWRNYQSMTQEQREVLRRAGSTSNTAAGHAGASTGLAKEASQPLPRVPGQLKPESPALVPATTNDGR